MFTIKINTKCTIRIKENKKISELCHFGVLINLLLKVRGYVPKFNRVFVAQLIMCIIKFSIYNG